MSRAVYECDQCGECCKHLLIEADHLDALREVQITVRGGLVGQEVRA